jgi:hypothetical protein
MAQIQKEIKYYNGKNFSEYDIRDIEALTESGAAAFAEEMEEIKGHQVYFIDFGGYFGFSALVFADGQHIYYANDYELHHKGKGREELRALYVAKLNRILFTEAELVAPTSDPDEIDRRRYYLQNYYGMRRKRVSCFQIFHNDAEEAAYTQKIKTMVLSPVCFAYYTDRDFVKKCAQLRQGIEAAANANADNFDYWKSAFLYEMDNHEYGINWQADYDVISCFANVDSVKDYENREKLFAAAHFSELQRSAYTAACAEYFRTREAL